MATYQRPGVYVEETLNPIAPVVGANSTSVAAFVGASDRGPLVPTLVTSWSQYVNTFGGWNSKNSNSNDLPLAVFSFFSNGGSSAYIQRAIGAGAGTASVDLPDALSAPALTVTAVNPGSWGTDIAVAVSNVLDIDDNPADPNWVYDLTIFYKGVTSAYSVERYQGVSNDPTSNRFVENVVNSAYVTVSAVTTTHPDSTGATPINLTGSSLDGAVVTESTIAAAVDGLDVLNNSLILNAAGVTTSTYVNQVIAYAEGRQDVFVVIDPIGADAAAQLTAVASYTASALAASYYPKVTIPDPTVNTAGATKTISPSGAVIGLYALTDTARGVFKAPAGMTARLGGVVAVPALTNAELDAMNSAASPVNAIRYIPGTGFSVMGARTLKPGYADRYIPVRRSLIYLRKALTDLTQFAIFEPNDQTLWKRLNDTCSNFLTDFWQQGGLRGANASQAFFVKCDSENNTVASIDAGEVNIEIGVALQRPAEFVIIKIGQYEGGTTVSVA